MINVMKMGAKARQPSSSMHASNPSVNRMSQCILPKNLAISSPTVPTANNFLVLLESAAVAGKAWSTMTRVSRVLMITFMLYDLVFDCSYDKLCLIY